MEPKFIPKEAIPVTLGTDQKVRIRLIDSVGFLVKDAAGHMEDGKERMVKTPWFEHAIPFHEAARIGTQEGDRGTFHHRACDHFGRQLRRTSQRKFSGCRRKDDTGIKKQQKPFLVLVNSQLPYKEEALKTAEEIQEKYQVTALTVNCDQLRKEDVVRIMENVLYEFPVSQIQFFIPEMGGNASNGS